MNARPISALHRKKKHQMASNGKQTEASSQASKAIISIEAFEEAALKSFSRLYKEETKLEEIETDLWKPEKGDVLRGVYIGKTFDSVVSQQGEAVPLLNFICRSEVDNSPVRRRVREGAVLKRYFETMPLNSIVELEAQENLAAKPGQSPARMFKVFSEKPVSK